MSTFRGEFYLSGEKLFATEIGLPDEVPIEQAPYVALEIARDTAAKFALAANRSADSIERRVIRTLPISQGANDAAINNLGS